MLYCTPEAALKTIRFKFMLKTVICNVFIMQVCWEAVPKTWPGSSKVSVVKCVVCAWNSTRSVGGRAELMSWTYDNSALMLLFSHNHCLSSTNHTCSCEWVYVSLVFSPSTMSRWMSTQLSSCCVLSTWSSFSGYPLIIDLCYLLLMSRNEPP